jgi:hypothetical protein
MKFITLGGGLRPVKNPKRFLIKWKTDSVSMFQTDVKLFLHPYWRSDEVYEEFPLIGTQLTFDFYNASQRVAVEVQGGQHTKFVKFFHGTRTRFLEQLKRDKAKEDYAEINGIKLVTIFPEDNLCPKLFEEFKVSLCKS